MSELSSKLNVRRMESVFALPLNPNTLADVVEKAKDWAVMHGAAMRSKAKFDSDSLQFAPFILLPSPFPRTEFEKAIKIQPILNQLMHKVAHDEDFLRSSLKETIQVDKFTKNLFDIFEKVHQEGIAQPITLGLLRSDLMLESFCLDKCSLNNAGGTLDQSVRPFCCWKQVEINTIASGFGWLGPSSAAIQRYVLEELGHSDRVKNLPENHALTGLCAAIIKAWEIYGRKQAVILFVVEDVTFNICDQRFHEFKIRQLNADVRVMRRTLTEIANSGKLGPNKELYLDDCEVGVIYFRAGYEPKHYPTQLEWDARLMMERSLAIKSPSIQYHLAGTKKVQQALARPNAVAKFLKEPDFVEAVHEIFTGLYSLDFDEYGEEAIKMALDNPDRFVLKPQREGGGNNVYGTDVRDALLEMKDSPERTAWILMEKINPPLISGYMVRPGMTELPTVVDLVSELGIFGVVIGDSNSIIYNKQVGHMLRTKLATANEGGVAAGLGALDSPYLVD